MQDDCVNEVVLSETKTNTTAAGGIFLGHQKATNPHIFDLIVQLRPFFKQVWLKLPATYLNGIMAMEINTFGSHHIGFNFNPKVHIYTIGVSARYE